MPQQGIDDVRLRAPVLTLVGAALRAGPAAATVLGAVLLVSAALPVVLAVVSGLLIGTLTGSASTGRLVAPVVLLAVVVLLMQALPPIATVLAEAVGRRLDRAVADRVMRCLLGPPGIEHLDDRAVTGAVADVRGGMSGATLRDGIVGTANLAVARGGAAASGLLLLTYRWWLAVPLLAAYLYAMSIISRTYQRQLESADYLPARLHRAVYLRDLVSTPPAGKEVRVFGLADWLTGRYRQEWREGVRDARGERSGVVRVGVLSGLVVLVTQLATMLLLTFDLVDGRLSVGRFTMYAVATVGLLGIMITTPDLVNITIAGGILSAVRRLPEPPPMSARQVTAGHPVAPPRGTITFEGVGFRYPGSATWVLRGLDLTIPAGRSTAIVGANGAGKTTLVKLLCGLYRPTEGRITVGGVDLATVDTTAWQRNCAALFQDWTRWQLTVRDNVRFGAPDRQDDPAALAAVARASGLDRVVGGLPDGWSTVLSREFGGVDLSGGQWQRVGLARALWAVSSGAGVLILDEPTSALDVKGETELFDDLIDQSLETTVLLISHRFSTVRHAEQIVVLADGRVAEQGTHPELLAAGGQYRRMFTVQAERFDGQPAPHPDGQEVQ